MPNIQKEANPYNALNNFKYEEYQNLTPFSLYKEVEKKRPSYREGETQELFLFFYFINILVKAKVDFLVKGGLILKLFLNDKVRKSNDIDVCTKDTEVFFKKINDALNNAKGDINFKVAKLRNREADEKYFYDIFVFKVEAYHNEDLIKTFIVDGKIVDNYNEIKKVKYQGPKIIDDDFHFYGVNLEYIAAEKIMALSCELTRPYKHLIDTYSLIKYGNLDVALLKEYLNEMLTYENKVRGRLNIPLASNDFKIKKDKSFIDDYYINAIQAGYRLSKEEMISEINNWVIKNIEA